MSRRRGLLVVGPLLLTSCLGTRVPPPTPSPERVADLERAVRDDADDLDALLSLVAARLFDGRPGHALELVAGARERFPDDPDLILLEGLAREAMGDVAAAREAFERYLASGWRGPVAVDALGRLARAEATLFRDRISGVLAGEAFASAPDPGLLAVMPVWHSGDVVALAPLAAALGEFLALGVDARPSLAAVAPARTAAVLDLLGIPGEDAVDSAVAVRVARLLGTGRVLTARLAAGEGRTLVLDATLLTLGRDGAATSARFGERSPDVGPAMLEEALSRFVAGLMGGGAAPAPEPRRPGSIEAWRWFGSGLLAAREGDDEEAARRFAEARRSDRGFDLAAAYARRHLGRLLASRRTAAESAWLAAALARERRAVGTLAAWPLGANVPLVPGDPAARAPAAELLGLDRMGAGSILELELVLGGPGSP